MASDLELAFTALQAKGPQYATLFAYYDGEQPLTYTSKRLEPIFKDLDAYFAENWCSVVIDACRDRVNLKGLACSGQQAAMDEIWERCELKLESDEVHEAAMVCGESFVVAWPDAEGKPDAYYNDPRMCHVFYEAEYPRLKRFAAKWWVHEDETLRMTLYYPDRLEYYGSTQKAESVSAYTALQALEPASAPNPFGVVPVFHFRSGQRKIKSDLASVTPVQNGINKLLTDMMVTAEYAAFPQRFIISNADIQGKLKNAPNEVWDLPAGDGMSQQTQAGQFAAADLKNYLEGIDNLATAISSITRTPKHYFFSVGSNLSGEALIAMEAPLNKKAQDRIDRYSPVWSDVGEFLLRIGGVEAEVEAVFDRPETIQPFTQAQTLQMYVSAGLPVALALKQLGWDEGEIREAEAIIKKAEMERQQTLAVSLMEAQRRFDQNTDFDTDTRMLDEGVRSD